MSNENVNQAGAVSAPLRTSPDLKSACPFAIPMHQDLVLTQDLENQFDEMRRQGSLAWTQFPYGTISDGKGWVATRYDDVKAILNDTRFSMSEKNNGDYPRPRIVEAAGAHQPVNFMSMDPPESMARRRTLLKHLTPEKANELRPVVERLVSEALDQIEAEGQGADLLPGLIRRVPLMLICELLGAPPEERHIFASHAHDIVASKHKTMDEAMVAVNTINGYFAELCQRKLDNPGNDLISALQHDMEVKGIWTDAEMKVLGFAILTAGHDSTASVTANTVHWLLHNPDLFARLRAEPDLVPRAVEEFLRLVPNGVPGTRTRVALEDIQVGDTLVRKGEVVLAVPHAANLDPEVFENPREFNLDRESEERQIAFGFGPHFCIGSLLAKMDIEMIVRGLTQRFKTLEPEQFDPDWQKHARTRGPATMKVRWTK